MMKPAAEYLLAESLIAHLQGDSELEGAVIAEPFDRVDQSQAIALAAAQYEFAIAVEPMELQLPTNPDDRTGVVTLRLAVHVMSTQQVTSGISARALAAAVQGAVLARCSSWYPEGMAGIPYALPELERVVELDFSKFEELANLTGSAIILTHKVNLKQYYI